MDTSERERERERESSPSVEQLCKLAQAGSFEFSLWRAVDGTKMDHPGGVSSLKELSSPPSFDIMISSMTIDNWHKQYTEGKKFLSEHYFEKVMKFVCVNLTKLNKASELLTYKDLSVILKREDVNASSTDLIDFLESFKSLPENERKRLEITVYSVNRKPPEVVVLVGGVLGGACSDSVDTFNCLNGAWLESPSLRLPRSLFGHQMEIIDNKLHVVGEGGSANKLFCLDLTDGSGWVEKPPMVEKRFLFASTTLNNK